MSNQRYIRQTLLGAIGDKGQDKLLSSHVAIVGCGGLGSIAAPYLAGAGVGKLTLVDGDVPDVTNLHRQVFFSTRKVAMTKSRVLAMHILKLNPEVEVNVIPKMITKDTIDDVLSDADVVLECTDNIQTKYMVNDYCNIHKIPMVYGAIHKYDGYVSLFENDNDQSIHLRDIFAEPNDDIPSCSEVGVMGTLAGIIGLMQANEAIKYISGAGECLIGKLLTYNILNNEQMKLRLKKTFDINLNTIFQQSSYIAEQVCEVYEISLEEVQQNRDKFHLVSILEDHEHKDIDSNVLHLPLSQMDIKSWASTESKPTIFYCMSGVRSGKLVNQILAVDPKSEVLSLAGGLKYFNNQK